MYTLNIDLTPNYNITVISMGKEKLSNEKLIVTTLCICYLEFWS